MALIPAAPISSFFQSVSSCQHHRLCHGDLRFTFLPRFHHPPQDSVVNIQSGSADAWAPLSLLPVFQSVVVTNGLLPANRRLLLLRSGLWTPFREVLLPLTYSYGSPGFYVGLVVLGLKPRTLHMLDKHCRRAYYSQATHP